ncbi:hypothetical protein BDV3_004561 [Batrachochytrium dendrobatidis]
MADMDDGDDKLLYSSNNAQDNDISDNHRTLDSTHVDENKPSGSDNQEANDADDSDSDDDIEIVLAVPDDASISGSGVPAAGNADSAHTAASAAILPANSKTVQSKSAIGLPIPRQDSTAPAAQQPATGSGKPTIDIDAVGQYEGKDILDVDTDQFEDKPWKKPGADITDYFNYGFNEQTWKTYCNKQKMMREEIQMQKRLNPYDLPMDSDYGFDMQAFAAQQRMLGNPMPVFSTGKYQRLPHTGYGADNTLKQQSIMGKRPRDEDDSVKVLGEQTISTDRSRNKESSASGHQGGSSLDIPDHQNPPTQMGFIPSVNVFGDIHRHFPGNPELGVIQQHPVFGQFSQGPGGNIPRMDHSLLPRPLDGVLPVPFGFDPRAIPAGLDPRASAAHMADISGKPTNISGQTDRDRDSRENRDRGRDRDRDRAKERDRDRGRDNRDRGRDSRDSRDRDRDRQVHARNHSFKH